MDDVVRFQGIIDAGESLALGEIGLHEAKIAGLGQFRQTRPLEVDLVIVAQIVHAQHGAALRGDEPAAHVVADESGSAGDEDLHEEWGRVLIAQPAVRR